MPSTRTWGRKESWVWPPRRFYYTYGAIFITVLLCGFFLYLRFEFGLSPLQRYYLPYVVRTWTSGWRQPTGQYQLLCISGPGRPARVALDPDVKSGTTPQPDQRALPLELSTAARNAGYTLLFREPTRSYQNKGLALFLRRWIYNDTDLINDFHAPLLYGLVALIIQLPFSLRKDIARRKQLRYGRRLKGPILVEPREFTRQLAGDGIGLPVDGQKPLLRIPRVAENTHFLIVGDTGAGKSTLVRSVLSQVAERGHSTIVYDPACEFVRQFYSPDRGDVLLNPLDARCPYWSPSAELQRKAEAKALAVSLFQPGGNTLKFFVESPQKIFAHLLSYLPTPTDLVHWMSHPEEIDRRVKDTELAALIDPKAPQQRTGVLGSLNMVADSFRLLPTETEGNGIWTATEWSKKRQGWIFITSRPALREALRPLISLWLDVLVLRLLTEPHPAQRPAWFVIDELASLQRLPQLHTAITENRKANSPVILGFQGRSQLEARYGEDAEAMLSQPATKIFLKTSEPRAARWVSEAIGEIEIEKLRETHYEGQRGGKNFALDRQTEPLVLPSEISGLDQLHAVLKYGNRVTRFAFPYIDLPKKHPGFIEREMDDFLPSPPPAADNGSTGEHKLVPSEHTEAQASLEFGNGQV
ncbi:MAG TPA: type IV secretion system DNA-binding domain-containing protein [Terracidiphilus sp.]|nr:type IV secretion system DNA-binding domain-containing protein [Terracidiphilus sp.]